MRTRRPNAAINLALVPCSSGLPIQWLGCSPRTICADGVNCLLESSRKHIANFIVGETLGTGHDQRMRSYG
jgi:hypothetical protein